MGSVGCVRSSAWHGCLSCLQITSALSRGLGYSPHHVAQLLDEERVVGHLEAFSAMRLRGEELEAACNAGLGDARLDGHRVHAPMRRTVGWLGVGRDLDQLRHAFVVDRSWLARARIVVQAGDASLDEPRAT